MTEVRLAADGLERLFAAIDSRDTDAFLAFLTGDAAFRFGSSPELRGHDAIRQGVDGFFASIAGSTHALKNVLEKDATLVCEGEVTYRRHDGSGITLPFANVFKLQGELISQYRIYIDINPLYAA
jgi:ketosteroid isomerase-like protein